LSAGVRVLGLRESYTVHLSETTFVYALLQLSVYRVVLCPPPPPPTHATRPPLNYQPDNPIQFVLVPNARAKQAFDADPKCTWCGVLRVHVLAWCFVCVLRVYLEPMCAVCLVWRVCCVRSGRCLCAGCVCSVRVCLRCVQWARSGCCMYVFCSRVPGSVCRPACVRAPSLCSVPAAHP
jgi:hypothetical protein